MGKITPSGHVKIIAGFIFSDERVFDKSRILLSKRLGPIDKASDLFSFNHTSYYKNEMGPGLQRRFLSFRILRDPKDIHRLKLFTNKLEKRFSAMGKRRINIDPGYITADKLVLLTTKNYTHRIYLKNGIYAEVTLFYKEKTFKPWEWTYPDYKTDDYIDFFNHVREKYLKDLKIK